MKVQPGGEPSEGVGSAVMADEYSHTLLVQLEENNAPRLKNKLVKYFQSKRSNGGDCEVDYENGSRTAVVRFRREEGKFCRYFVTLSKRYLEPTL